MRGWVLVKGMKQDQRHWLGFQDRFAEELGTEVMCLDLPGAGTEVDNMPPRTVEAMAEDLRTRWLRQGGTPGEWGILGLSLGGMAAMAWANQHPTDFQRVVIGNSSSRDSGAPYERLSWRSWPKVLRTLVIKDDVAREEVVLTMTTSDASPARRTEVAHAFARLQREAPYNRQAFVRQLLAGSRFRAPRGLKPPVLVLNGQGDTFVDPRCSERLAAHLGAEFVRHPTAGHDLSLDAPDWLMASVKAWVR